VTSGINLAYFFSKVDRIRYGCDTKLPHNITGLVGVMDGHASDLRTGLPWQTVEIHEPVRLLMVIEAPTRRILEAANLNPAVRRLFVNRWVRLASLDPDGGATYATDDGGWIYVSNSETPQIPPALKGGVGAVRATSRSLAAIGSQRWIIRHVSASMASRSARPSATACADSRCAPVSRLGGN
jgi:hypothetical protein